MKPTKEIFEKINSSLLKIIEFAPNLKDHNYDEIFYNDDKINEIFENEEEIEDFISFQFPGEFETTDIYIDDFIKLGDEMDSIKIENNGYIKTEKNRYFVVSFNSFFSDLKNYHLPDIECILENYDIKLDTEPYIIGIAATKLNLYNEDYWSAIGSYICIKISLKNNIELNYNEEIDIVNSFIFEISDKYNIALSFSDIYYLNEYDDDEIENTEKIESIMPFNEGMKIFTSAVQINDNELKFLNFYKVLEHFAPIAVNIEANELMRKKLDIPRNEHDNGDYIRSIYTLANLMKSKFNDEDLIKATFLNCFDFVYAFKFLPESLQFKIKKQLKIEKDIEFDYFIDRQTIESASNIVAKTIYKTRNKFVHAKSNFEHKVEEFNETELEQLNKFMKLIASLTIKWYSRQPSHMKLNII